MCNILYDMLCQLRKLKPEALKEAAGLVMSVPAKARPKTEIRLEP